MGNSVCAQKVRITMLEKKLDWKTHEVNLFTCEQYSPEYLKLNPKGVVPTLVVDGQPIIESSLICEYLDEKYSIDRNTILWWQRFEIEHYTLIRKNLLQINIKCYKRCLHQILKVLYVLWIQTNHG